MARVLKEVRLDVNRPRLAAGLEEKAFVEATRTLATEEHTPDAIAEAKERESEVEEGGAARVGPLHPRLAMVQPCRGLQGAAAALPTAAAKATPQLANRESAGLA